MAVILELGQHDTFLFDSPGGTTTNNLPEGLKDLEAGIGVGKYIHQIYCLAFGINGAYLLTGRTAQGAIIRRHNLPPSLESWLIDTSSNMCRRDIPSLSVELGPNNSFFARDRDSYRWHNLPDALEEAIQQRLSPMGWRATPEVILLGADGAFVYANHCGGHSYALGNYPKLQQLIQGLHTQNVNGHTGFALLQWISMSIHQPGHFIALHHSGHHIAEVHPQSTQALTSMASTFPVKTLAPISRPQASPSMMSPQSLSPTMMAPPTPLMTPKAASPPILQQPAFRPPAYTQVSSPFPQAQAAQPARPAVQTQQSAPVAQVPVVQQTARPVPQKRHSSGLGRFFSDTASGVLSNVIASEITSAANVTSGTVGGGDSGGWGGDGSD